MTGPTGDVVGELASGGQKLGLTPQLAGLGAGESVYVLLPHSGLLTPEARTAQQNWGGSSQTAGPSVPLGLHRTVTTDSLRFPPCAA